jgi:hypothetical protein
MINAKFIYRVIELKQNVYKQIPLCYRYKVPLVLQTILAKMRLTQHKTTTFTYNRFNDMPEGIMIKLLNYAPTIINH